MQIAAARSSAVQSPAQAQSAASVDLTALAVAQTNAKMTASAGAALAQTTSELTGTLADISV